MVTATWNGVTLAQSDDTIIIEGNHYFPPGSVNRDALVDSATHTTCHWKGEASYYTVVAAGEKNPDAAWYYPEAKPEAAQIRNYVAFWKGVQVK